jgi:hypothetical protein
MRRHMQRSVSRDTAFVRARGRLVDVTGLARQGHVAGRAVPVDAVGVAARQRAWRGLRPRPFRKPCTRRSSAGGWVSALAPTCQCRNHAEAIVRPRPPSTLAFRPRRASRAAERRRSLVAPSGHKRGPSREGSRWWNAYGYAASAAQMVSKRTCRDRRRRRGTAAVRSGTRSCRREPRPVARSERSTFWCVSGSV